MHSFPLLSEAYGAALLTAHEGPDVEGTEPDRADAIPIPRPDRGVLDCEDEDELETARTRPLRLDRSLL